LVVVRAEEEEELEMLVVIMYGGVAMATVLMVAQRRGVKVRQRVTWIWMKRGDTNPGKSLDFLPAGWLL
jgi:hypothetical protein